MKEEGGREKRKDGGNERGREGGRERKAYLGGRGGSEEDLLHGLLLLEL